MLLDLKSLVQFNKKLYIHLQNSHLEDIIAQAQSGTGKTGCFVIGTLQKLYMKKILLLRRLF